MIIGDAPQAEAVRRKLALLGEADVTLVGLVDEHELARSDPLSAVIAAVRGSGERGVDRLIIATKHVEESFVIGALSFCREAVHQAEPHSPGRAIYGSAARIDHLGELGVVAYHTAPAPRSSKMLKRGLDLIIAVPAMILLLPVMAVIALAIRLEDRGGSSSPNHVPDSMAKASRSSSSGR